MGWLEGKCHLLAVAVAIVDFVVAIVVVVCEGVFLSFVTPGRLEIVIVGKVEFIEEGEEEEGEGEEGEVLEISLILSSVVTLLLWALLELE